MKKTVTFLFFFCLLSCCQTVLAENKTITFSTHIKKDSILFKKTYAIMDETFRRLGYSFKMESYPALRALQRANDGYTDGEAHRIFGIEQKYTNLVRIPEIQMRIYNYAYSLKPIKIENGWSGLGEYNVAVRRGSIFVSEMAQKHAKSVYELNNHESLFKFLIAGRADIAINSPIQVKDMLKDPQFQNIKLTKHEPPLTALPIFAYLNKKHDSLVPLIAEKLRDMKIDGTYNEIMKKFRVQY